METDLSRLNIMMFDDHYMICNENIYFRVGILEGRVLTRLLEGQQEDSIVEEENMTHEEFSCLIDVFKKNGVIGSVKRKKFNPLYMKFPLFSADIFFEKLCGWIRAHNKIKKIGFVSFSIFMLAGIITVFLKQNEILSWESFRLPFYQYVLVYVIHTGIIFFHEMGHGFMCKYFGGKVGKIGLALIVMNPAMYCDISGIRMFYEKKKQVLCSMAGFMVNAVFVGFFSCIYLLYPFNMLKILIILNLLSIIINAVPFIRLDGYWILSFGSGIQNLYTKSMLKLKSIGHKKEFSSWKDYFILIYGIINCLIIFYCCIRFAITIINVVLQFIIRR